MNLLPRRITIQTPSATQDANGEPLTTWTTWGTAWADIEDQTGRQYIASGGVQNAVQTQITIRWRAGVVPSMRITHGANTYRIEAVLGQDKRFMQLMCARQQ
jgi:SPP1 family predicted phage head-tail adaptor